MIKSNLQKIVNDFFSASQIISYYSKPRLHLSEKKLFKKYLIRKGKVLDLCCGAGRVAIPLAKMGFDVIGIDINPKMIKAANKIKKKYNIKNVKFVCKDASLMKIKKNYFDYILIMNNSLEHIVSETKRKSVIKKAYDSLKNGGFFITSFHSSFNIFKAFVKLLIGKHSKKYLFYNLQLKPFDLIISVKDKPIFFHIFFYHEIKKIINTIGFKILDIIPINILDSKKNRFKNIRFYQYMKPFLYCYWVMLK